MTVSEALQRTVGSVDSVGRLEGMTRVERIEQLTGLTSSLRDLHEQATEKVTVWSEVTQTQSQPERQTSECLTTRVDHADSSPTTTTTTNTTNNTNGRTRSRSRSEINEAGCETELEMILRSPFVGSQSSEIVSETGVPMPLQTQMAEAANEGLKNELTALDSGLKQHSKEKKVNKRRRVTSNSFEPVETAKAVESVAAPVGKANEEAQPEASLKKDTSVTGESGSGEDAEQEVCFICLDTFSDRFPGTALPCYNELCREKQVHAKCIYEWRQTDWRPLPNHVDSRRNEYTLVSSCPLCRGDLKSFTYNLPDAINSSMFHNLECRRKFLLSPAPPKAGFVRCFVKLNHVAQPARTDGALNQKTQDLCVYELYLQAPTTLKYPLGPVPDSFSPKDGDKLLVVANRTRFPRKSGCGAMSVKRTADGRLSTRLDSLRRPDMYTPISQLDLFMTDAGYKKKMTSDSYLASVKSSFSGFKHEVLVPVRGRAVAKDPLTGSQQRNGLPYCHYEETCCVHFVQNRKSNKTAVTPGPRKIQVCLPKLASEKKVRGSHTASAAAQRDLSEPKITPYAVYSNLAGLNLSGFPQQKPLTSMAMENEVVKRIPSRLSHALTYKSLNMPLAGVLPGEFTFGRNKEPYWLDSIQAYSLDFKGRVTQPSNKNFQLLLDLGGENTHGMENVIPELMRDKLRRKGDTDREEIALQFGKVGEHKNSEIFTMDFRWPLTPLQALGICLGACDRNIVG